MSADYFGTRPFVAGSLTGLRAFRVTPTGHLTGIFVTTYRLAPGVNEAVCAAPSSTQLMNAFSAAMRHAVGIGPRPSAASEHELLSLSCRCGFYAYFDGTNEYLPLGASDTDPRVAAIVEGFGKCVVGERGFRAEKLRLVALVLPEQPKQPGRFARLRDALALWLATHHKSTWAVLLGGCLLMAAGILSTLSGWSPYVASLVGGGVWGTAVARFERRGKRLETQALLDRVFGAAITRPIDWDQLLANYPGVPVYPTTKAALAAHPLTVPEPGPEPEPKARPAYPMNSAAAAMSNFQIQMHAAAEAVRRAERLRPKDPGAES